MSRYTHDDMPALRSVRETLRRMMDTLNGFKAEESELGMLIAMASVGDQLQAEFDAAGRALDRLERTAPGAGQSPASTAGASMRQRRAVSPGQAKGPAIAQALKACLTPCNDPPPADRLSASRVAADTPWREPTIAYDLRQTASVDLTVFSGPFGQILPADRPAERDQLSQGAHFHGCETSHNA